MTTAGSMLSADIFSQKEREEGLVEAYLNIHSLLEAIVCNSALITYRFRGGKLVTQPGDNLVKETPLMELQGNHHPCWMTFQCSCSRDNPAPISNTSPCAVSKPNILMCVPGGT